jgi:lipid-binding SYLF domain-containing protein
MMKKLAICIGLCLVASPVFAALTKDDTRRLSESAAVLSELRSTPDRGIPEDLWNKAECVLVFPSVKKAAFLVGGEYGSGVMSCRQAHRNNSRGPGGWSAPIFMHLAKGSLGPQIGAEAVDLVLLVMNQRGVDRLLQDKVTLGADASVAAGPVGRSGTAATDAQLNAELLSYSRSHGVFAGLDLSGGSLRPDTDADARAYGPTIAAHAIVDGSEKVTVPPPARAFLNALARDVQGTSGRH